MIENELKELIRNSGLSLRKIAETAGVEHTALWRWYSDRHGQRHYDVGSAEKVHMALTGRPFAVKCEGKKTDADSFSL